MMDEIKPPEKFQLSVSDKQTHTWEKILEQMHKRLAEARAKNDHKQSEVDTAELRGKIAELKYWIALAEDRKSL